MVAAKLANLAVGRPRENGANLPDCRTAEDAAQQSFSEWALHGDVEAESDPAPAPVSISQAATLLNVSERTVKTARAVQREGAPELVAAVEAGKVSVSAAGDVATLPPGIPEGLPAVSAHSTPSLRARQRHLRR
jgi:hypothetical protein